ncbi:MAG: hypothetical protein JNK02_08810 [Planctomycetes bacterium]|nr:hypothetical protein [Planctomycetota bacterium]
MSRVLALLVALAAPWTPLLRAAAARPEHAPCAALALSPAPAPTGRPALQDAPICKKCQSTGRLPCAAHPRSDCLLEDEVLFCSVVADCTACAGAAWVPCTDCDNAPARARIEEKKASVATRRVALEYIDQTMKRPIRKAESKHFVLVWEMDRLKVDKKWLESHELLHLYLKRLEALYDDYCARMQITDKEFAEKFRVFVWQFPQDHHDAGLRFCRQSAKGGVKLMGQTPSYSVCGNKQNFQDDERLHRNIVHSVTHLILSAQRPVAWIGNIKAGWLDEGLAHFFEDRYWDVCDTYCYQEANTNVDFKGGRFRLAVRRMVEEGKFPPTAEVFQQNVDTLTLPMHATAFSYVEFLLNRDAERFNQLVKKLKAKVATRDALREIYGWSVFDFEAQWKSWVLSTYPTK